MRLVIASEEDLERLFGLYHVDTVAGLAERMVAEGDAPDGSLLVDHQGRLCLVDTEPNAAERAFVTGTVLDDMCDHYGVGRGDLVALRRRMLFEGGWRSDEVGIEGGRLFTAVPPARREG